MGTKNLKVIIVILLLSFGTLHSFTMAVYTNLENFQDAILLILVYEMYYVYGCCVMQVSLLNQYSH